ncbi:hypothetical protein ACVW1C_007515 [Bradyrhizobium sp. USDA 4011]
MRERAKQHRRDPLSYFQVPLPESVIHKLASDLTLENADDVPVNDRTWRTLIGLVIASLVKSAIAKKR